MWGCYMKVLTFKSWYYLTLLDLLLLIFLIFPLQGEKISTWVYLKWKQKIHLNKRKQEMPTAIPSTIRFEIN